VAKQQVPLQTQPSTATTTSAPQGFIPIEEGEDPNLYSGIVTVSCLYIFFYFPAEI